MLVVCVVIAVAFFVSSMSLPESPNSKTIGPSFFPRVVSVFLVISSIISFITTYRKEENKRVELGNIKLIVCTIVITSLFIFAWQLFGLFYLWLFILMAVLVYIYNQEKHGAKKVLKSCAISLVLDLFVFIVFQQILNVTFAV
jgi:hypothetical protein